ncbi:MAG: sugar transferase [Bacteroidia bacterium]|nr:sugar transferase [Bacteroidia bacterium]
MNKKRQVTKYLISDYTTAAVAWSLFYIYRKTFIEPIKFGYRIPINFDFKYFLGLIIIPSFWIFIYYLIGYYKDIYRKSRLTELGQTFFTSLTGVIIIFFALILDDTVYSYVNYYYSFIVLFSLQFLLSYIPRIIITSNTNWKIHNRIIGFNTIIIGSNNNAIRLYKELISQNNSSGNKFIGFININSNNKNLLAKYISHLGDINDLKKVIKDNHVEEVIIAIESSEHNEIGEIINKLEEFNVAVKVIPDMFDILTGKVKIASPYSAPLIEISRDLMPAWQEKQENMKRIIDVFASIIVLIIFFPLYLALAIGVIFSSRGPVLYHHERIGRYGKPFTIYKFRSMYVNAEESGPALSCKDDQRVTKFGRYMRQLRLDELPQFYNVLIGDMSLVGPRPERQYYIDMIIKKAPHYVHLHRVRPGITSWGQVKYGYAGNVREMISRLKYDILYIKNMSLYVDIKILIYTIKIVLQGRGR